MKVTKETEEFIYAIKENKYDDNLLKNIAVSYFVEKYGVERDRYTNECVFNLVKEAFLDYLSTADNAIYELNNYFEAQRIKMNMTDDVDITNLEIYCILSVFQLAQVKNKDGKYVNGFGVLNV